jgi:hypothetical protein
MVLTGVTGCTPQPDGAPTTATASVVVIGDDSALAVEDSAGLAGEAGAADAWPDLLGAETDAVPGSGYLTAQPNSVAGRLEAAPEADVLVLALGARDAERPGVPDELADAAVSAAFTAAGAAAGSAGERVVVVAPLLSRAGGSPAMEAWTTRLRAKAADYGFTFVEAPAVSGDAASADGLRLGPAGQQAVADALRPLLAEG